MALSGSEFGTIKVQVCDKQIYTYIYILKDLQSRHINVG